MRVVVVGAGVAGASVAYHAGRQGADTILVDREADGQATAAGAGIVCPWTSRVTDPVWHRLANAAVDHYPRLLADLAADGETEVGYRRVGALRLTTTDAVHDEVAARAAGSPEAGEISMLTGAQAKALFPPLRGDTPAVHVAGGARVDGRLLRDALRRAAVRNGTTFRTGTATLGDSGVEVDGQRIDADAVVVAAGAWCGELLDPIGVRIDVAPQRGQIVHLALPDVDTRDWPVVLPESSHYLLAFGDHRVVVGATREAGSGFDYRVTAGGLAEVLEQALSVAPGLARASVLETRIGFRPVGPDALPLVGAVPGRPGLTVVTGLGPTGLTLGPYAGRLAAAIALGEQPEFDVTPLDPLRTSS